MNGTHPAFQRKGMGSMDKDLHIRTFPPLPIECLQSYQSAGVFNPGRTGIVDLAQGQVSPPTRQIVRVRPSSWLKIRIAGRHDVDELL